MLTFHRINIRCVLWSTDSQLLYSLIEYTFALVPLQQNIAARLEAEREVEIC